MARSTPQLAVSKEGKTAVLEIYDDIGPWWLGMIDAKSVSRELKAAGDDVDEIEVRINSLGGSVFEGLAIHNILRQHKAKVRVRIDGIAASIASVIAMAGDVVEMPASALLMIHNPWTIAVGEKGDMLKAADLLDTCKASCVETYARKTGKSAEDLAAWMDEETWLSATEAKERGFADEVLEAAEVKAAFEPDSLKDRFKRAPLDVAALFRPHGQSPKGSAMSTNATPAAPADSQTPAAPVTPTTLATNAALASPAGATPAAPEAGMKTITEADLEKARTDAIAAENKRQSDIRALCAQAKLPEKSEHFCNDAKFTVQDVRDHLFEAMCKANTPPPENNVTDPAGGEGGKKDPYAAFRKEFADNRAALAKVGVTDEDGYVRSRCKDEGIDPPPAKSA